MVMLPSSFYACKNQLNEQRKAKMATSIIKQKGAFTRTPLRFGKKVGRSHRQKKRNAIMDTQSFNFSITF